MDTAAAAGLPEAWSQVRAPVIVPLLRLAVAVCLTMSVLLFLERMYMAVVIAGVRLFRFRPERRYRCDPLPEDDPELGSSAFPVVLVQIPMFNEREVRTTGRSAAALLAAIAGEARARFNGGAVFAAVSYVSGFGGSLTCAAVVTTGVRAGCCCRCTSCPSAPCAGCRGRRTGWWCRCSTTPPTRSLRYASLAPEVYYVLY